METFALPQTSQANHELPRARRLPAPHGRAREEESSAEEAHLAAADEDADDSSSEISDTSETSWAEWVHNGKDSKPVDSEKMTQLSAVCAIGDAGQTKSLLSRSTTDPNAIDSDHDRRPLHWAAARGRVRCVELLIAAGADPMLPDASGRTAAELARRLGNDGVAMRLELGVPLPDTKKVFEGLDGLSLAAALDQPLRLQRLLQYSRVDANARDPDGDRTPMHWAAARGLPKCVRQLLDANASPYSIDAAGRTPADLALECRRGEVHAMLVSAQEATRPWCGLACAPSAALAEVLQGGEAGCNAERIFEEPLGAGALALDRSPSRSALGSRSTHRSATPGMDNPRSARGGMDHSRSSTIARLHDVRLDEMI